MLTFLSCVRIVKKCPKLKSKYKSHVKVAIEYANTIDDFNNLLGLRTLAHHCFSPEPFAYVLRAIEIKEKSRCSFSFIAILNSLHSFFFFKCFYFTNMTMKFNQEMYAKIRVKKNEPLSNLRKKVVRVVDNKTPVTQPPPSQKR